MLPRLQVFTRAAEVDVLVVDAPGWTDASTAWLALCRILSDTDTAFAQDYLKQAGYKALKGELREKKAFASFAFAASPSQASRRAGARRGRGQGSTAIPIACGTPSESGCVRRAFRPGKSQHCSATKCPATASPKCTPGPTRAT